MKKLIIGIVGILIFIYGLSLSNTLREGEKLAAARDDKKNVFAMISDDAPPSCEWTVQKPERVIADNKTQAVVVQTKNPEKRNCESYISLRAPGFNLKPPKEEQKVTLKPGGKGSIAWILTPQRKGTFDITVSDIINTHIYGITVTNVFGFSAAQAKFFSSLTSLFGPMLTLPWWWDRWRQRKPKQEAKKEVFVEKST